MRKHNCAGHDLGHSHGPDPAHDHDDEHDEVLDDPPEWADLPDGEDPPPAEPKKTDKPKPEAKPKGGARARTDKASDKASIADQMEKFRKRAVESGIVDDKGLYAALSTVYRSSLEVQHQVDEFKASLGTGAHGLTPEGEKELIHELGRRICIQVEAATRETMAKHRLHVRNMMSIAVAGVCLLSAGIGAGAAYGFGWAGGTASMRTAERELMGVFARGPDSVAATVRLLANNDAKVMLDQCNPADIEIYAGRKACRGAFWLEPAPAPAAKGGK